MATAPGSDLLFFQDESGTEVLEADLEGLSLKAGQRVALRGTNYVALTEFGVSLGKRPVINNEGEHAEVECTGTLYLPSGLHPLQVLWYNYKGQYALGASYAGPGFARQAIPEAALFRLQDPLADATARWVKGLQYRCYEGEWRQTMPRFQRLSPVKAGVCAGL